MLTIYAQYSFGGYKIFRLTNDHVEEVTGVNRHGITDSVIQLFSHYGIKMLNCHDAQGLHIFFVNDIPCRELDDVGRNKTCSLMICGTNLNDAKLLRRLAVMIAFELCSFETFFSSLFTISDTLNFDYLKFEKFIKLMADKEVFAEDCLRNAMLQKPYPIVVYTTSDRKTVLEPLYPRFGKGQLRTCFSLKWDEQSRKIVDSSIDRIGFVHLLQQILNKIATLWKN